MLFKVSGLSWMTNMFFFSFFYSLYSLVVPWNKFCHDPKFGALEFHVMSNKHHIHIYRSNQQLHNKLAILPK